METKDKNKFKKSKKYSISTVLYLAASFVAVFAVMLLINNIYLFISEVNQYVAQGYPVATVTSQLIPSQLLPGIFEPIAIYGGIAVALVGIGKINKKVSKYLTLLVEQNICDNNIEERILQEDTVDIENKNEIELIENNGIS